MAQLKTVSRQLFVPPMNDVAAVLLAGLSDHFASVQVGVEPCPDLTQFGFAAKGLGGRAEYAECGSILTAMFNPHRQRDIYTMQSVGAQFGRKDAFVIGSGAGSTVEVGVNSEWTGNAVLKDGKVVTNLSKVAYVTDMRQLPQPYVVRTSDHRGQIGCIGNLLYTDGAGANLVLHVRARVRRAEKNWSTDPHDQEFVRIMRTALAKAYPNEDQQIILGGVLLVKRGKTVTHVMPPYFPPAGAKPGKSFPDMGGWAECFYYSENQLVGATTLMNHQGKALPAEHGQFRRDHTHFFTQDGKEAGHYHYDVSLDVVEYEAFLVPVVAAHEVDLLFRRSRV